MLKEETKILIVDDSDFSRREISSILEAENLKVVGEASSAHEAIKIINERHIDIAIVDIVMPQISGIQLTEELSESHPDTYVIMISSLSQESIIMEAIAAGASDYIQKPIKKELLLQSVYKIIKSANEFI